MSKLTFEQALAIVEQNDQERKSEARRRELREVADSVISPWLSRIETKLGQIEAKLRQEVLDAVPGMIPAPREGKRGKKGDPGDKPVLGVDYDLPTAEEVARKVKVPAPDNELTLEEVMATITERLPALIKEHAPGGFSIVSRRRSYLKFVSITGTKNGSNREFYLPEAPAYGTQFILVLNSAVVDNDYYTLKGVTLTYASSVPAPKAAWNHFGIIHRP